MFQQNGFSSGFPRFPENRLINFLLKLEMAWSSQDTVLFSSHGLPAALSTLFTPAYCLFFNPQ